MTSPQETSTKERPILFNEEMVRAILDGRKTMTRRVINPQPHPDVVYFQEHVAGRFKPVWGDHTCDHTRDDNKSRTCPYGQPGDRLWVRETWGYHSDTSESGGNVGARYWSTVSYPASGEERHRVYFDDFEAMVATSPKQNLKYPEGYSDLDTFEQGLIHDDLLTAWWNRQNKKPSIHIPRAYSRITLEVVDVRVERVQEITEGNAVDEGCAIYPINMDCNVCRDAPGFCSAHQSPRGQFANLWDSINEKRGFGWDVNPWVWCVSFKRIDDKASSMASATTAVE